MFAASVLFIIVFGSVSADNGKCYNSKRDFYPFMGTRSSYQLVHENITRPESSCTPVQMWMLTRHGTSYPSKETLSSFLSLPKIRDEIIKNHEMGNGLVCPSDLENLRKWQPDPNFNDETAQLLTVQGKRDVRLLAKRLKSAFPELLQTDPAFAKPTDYVFQSSDTQRAKTSMQSFIRGLFGTSTVNLPQESTDNDTLLQIYDNCPIWNISHRNSNTSESDKFIAGLEIRDLLRNLSERLGYSETIEFDTVKSMYDMCRFETARYSNRVSTWCIPFSKEDMKVLEYQEDLDQYYRTGPGSELSVKLGCQTLTDMFEYFEQLETDDFVSAPKGIFYFSQAIAVQSLMAVLKIGEESPPISSENYAAADERKYRSSLLSPFASNILAVFYKCNGAKLANKVTFYASERLVILAGCKGGLCDWDFLKREFASAIEQCNTDFCYDVPETEPIEEANQTASAIASTDTDVVRHLTMITVSLVTSALWARKNRLT